MGAGYRRGYTTSEAAVLENTPRGNSSVTTPLSYGKLVYMQATLQKQIYRCNVYKLIMQVIVTKNSLSCKHCKQTSL